MTRDLIYTKLKEILVRMELIVPDGYITEEFNIVTDLGADSLDLVDIVVALEDEYRIEISDAEKDALHTVKDCIDLIERKLA